MSAPAKVAGFLIALAVVFGAAIGFGSVLDPVAESATADSTDHDADDAAHGDMHETSADEEIPGGLMVSQAGYTLRLADPSVDPGRSVPVSFSILGPDGPVTTYDVEHEKQLHLIAVRRDFTGFQHVSRDGEPVTDLQPYLGAYGHLVALRSGDLAYLHVHPDGTPGDGTTEPGPDVTFFAAVPSAGTYHLYLDFQHRGEVHTAAFTLDAH